MTGTSMDGIDISLVNTNGIHLRRIKNYFYEFNSKTKQILLNILDNDITFKVKKREFLNDLITIEHIKALKKTDFLNMCDVIGFHGQTIYHNPQQRVSIQLGNAHMLSEMTSKNIVFDFRSKDVMMGGEGAPLAPIYHKYIIEELKLELPTCILNIGGIANLTYWDGVDLIGFDTGPGNNLMDKYSVKICNGYFDLNGKLASKGTSNKDTVKNFMSQEFFNRPPPKSLDKNSFLDMYYNLLEAELEVSDTMSTLADFTIESITFSIKSLSKKINNIIVTGGGCRNKYLMKSLREKSDANFIEEKHVNFNFDFIESELIAYLSARSLYNLPFTFPSTTGISKPSSGGKIYKTL